MPAADAAIALVREHLEERRPDEASHLLVAPLSGDASTRRYYRLQDGGRTYVVALYPEPFEPEALTYLTVHGLLEGYGIPVPATVDVDGRRGIVVQEDLGDCTLQEELRGCAGRRRFELYREAVDEIALLQQKAALGVQEAECFRIAFDIEKLTWELHYFLKHFVEGHRGGDLSVEDRATLSESFHVLSQEIASWPRVLCHRDYHSRNLMQPRRAALLDRLPGRAHGPGHLRPRLAAARRVRRRARGAAGRAEGALPAEGRARRSRARSSAAASTSCACSGTSRPSGPSATWRP